MNNYSIESQDDEYLRSDSNHDLGEISLNGEDYSNVKYLSRSFIEMPETGEVNYISTIIGVSGNPVYKGKGLWVPSSERNESCTVKVDKDDIRAKRHYVKTLHKDGREVKIWECGLCGKEFRFQYTLVRHIPTHTDVRNYQCDICPKAFRQLSTLAQHKATHWNMRPFSCDFCKKSFNRISTLISHKKIHYDEKKHVCPFCGKGFHQKGNLRNHMYTHTNERPYKCDICSKGFNQKSNLVCHKLSTHTRRDHYHCDTCNIRFGKQNLYTCHMESIHSMSVNMSRKHPSPPSIWPVRTEPQCAIVDEANNLIYQLPVAYEKKKQEMMMNGFDSSFSVLSEQLSKYSENEVLAVINQEPSVSMRELLTKKQVPFVLYYESGESYPKICKTVLKDNQFILVHPSNDDINKYFIANVNKISPKFPIVATIIQKRDSCGKSQVIVVPAGSAHSHLIEDSDENSDDFETAQDNFSEMDTITLHGERSGDESNGEADSNVILVPQNRTLNVSMQPRQGNNSRKAAIIYTKTQPNIRQVKTTRKPFDFGLSPGETNAAMNPGVGAGEKYSFPTDLEVRGGSVSEVSTSVMCEDSSSSSSSSNETEVGFVYVPQEKLTVESRDPLTLPAHNQSISTTHENFLINVNKRYDCTTTTKVEEKSVFDMPDIYFPQVKEFSFSKEGHGSMFPALPLETLISCPAPCSSKLPLTHPLQQPSSSLTSASTSTAKPCCDIEIMENKIQDTNIKKEPDCSEIMQMDDSCNDIEPTLFDNLKEPFSKYHLDFDSEFDLLEDYNFTDSFLENVVNNNMADVGQSQDGFLNPGSSYIFSSL